MTNPQEATWSMRYRDVGDEFLFGTSPNQYLVRHTENLLQGNSALCVADGEGRNSVWLAEQGLDVTATEISQVAVEKARRLAAGRDVQVRYQVDDMLSSNWPPPEFREAFDWVVGVFIQFVGAEDRAIQFANMKRATKPGGRIMLQGYTPEQLKYRTGGPSTLENLYTAEILRSEFSDWTIEELIEYEADIHEGSGHKGRSALIGFIARKIA